MRVLVIDPIKSELKNFTSLVEKSGHNAIPSLTAKDAFQQIRKEPIDVVVASKMTVDIPSNLIGMLLKQSDKNSALPFLQVESFAKDENKVIEFLNSQKTGEQENVPQEK